jgi:hypothetical protein
VTNGRTAADLRTGDSNVIAYAGDQDFQIRQIAG